MNHFHHSICYRVHNTTFFASRNCQKLGGTNSLLVPCSEVGDQSHGSCAYDLSTCYYLYLLCPGRDVKCCNEHVCLFVCVCVCILTYLENNAAKLHQIFVHVACSCRLVLLLWHCGMLCTSSFTDDILGGRAQCCVACCVGMAAGQAWATMAHWLAGRLEGQLGAHQLCQAHRSRCWLSGGWTRLLRGLWCMFRRVLHACSKLCTGGKVCYLWLYCLFKNTYTQ